MKCPPLVQFMGQLVLPFALSIFAREVQARGAYI